MFRPFIVVTALVAALTALTTAPPAVVNVAHRGASAYAPENTLAALALAREQGAGMFEIDVRQTSDHELILMHDSTLERTTDAEEVYPDRSPWRVEDFTLDEIRALDAGSWVSPAYRGERVPTLEEALEAMRDSGLGLLLEIKEPHLYPGIEARVAAELLHDPYWLEPGRTVVQSFDWASMRTFHAIIPDVPVGLLGKPATRDLPALASYADQINPSHAALTRDYVHRVHEAGMRVFTWTVDDPETMRRLISWGVDGIITNKPDVLREIAADTATARTSVEPDRLPLWSLAESGV